MLHRLAEEHQTFQGCVKRFQSWLLTETKRLTTLMERDDTAEDKLRALQVSCRFTNRSLSSPLQTGSG